MSTADDVFRDYITDGIPSSGAHKPNKAEIRELLTGYETAIASADIAGVFGFGSGPIVIGSNGASLQLGDSLAVTGDKTTNAKVYAWDTDTNVWRTADLAYAPFRKDQGSGTVNSSSFKFCKLVQEATGRDVYLVQYAAANKPLETFLDPANWPSGTQGAGTGDGTGGTNDAWGPFTDAVTAALAAAPALDGVKMSVLLFNAGGSSLSNPVDEFTALIRAYIAQARAEAWAGTNMRVVLGETGDVGFQIVREGLRRYVQNSEDVYTMLAAARGIELLADNTHFTGAGMVEYGIRLYQALLAGATPYSGFVPMERNVVSVGYYTDPLSEDASIINSPTTPEIVRQGISGMVVANALSRDDLNYLNEGDFSDDNDGGFWTEGTNWAIASAKATKTAGAAGNLDQDVPTMEGEEYVLTYTVSNLSGGTVTPKLVGSTTVSGTARTANGTYVEKLVAPAGSTVFRFEGDTAGAYDITNASLTTDVAYVRIDPTDWPNQGSLWVINLSTDATLSVEPGAPTAGGYGGTYSYTIKNPRELYKAAPAGPVLFRPGEGGLLFRVSNQDTAGFSILALAGNPRYISTGTLAKPSLTFDFSPFTGFYQPAADEIAYVIADGAQPGAEFGWVAWKIDGSGRQMFGWNTYINANNTEQNLIVVGRVPEQRPGITIAHHGLTGGDNTGSLNFQASGLVRQAIVSITKGTTTTFEVTGHGLSSGNKPMFYGIGGMTEFNDRELEITVTDADHFTVAVDSRSFAAYASGGFITMTLPGNTTALAVGRSNGKMRWVGADGTSARVRGMQINPVVASVSTGDLRLTGKLDMGQSDAWVNILTWSADGKFGFGTGITPTCRVDIDDNVLRLRQSKTPSSATDTGNAGDIAWDGSYFYVCTATNTWTRAALSTW